jgi:hypothetical protein
MMSTTFEGQRFSINEMDGEGVGSIEGKLMMLDGVTPHVAVVVQAIRNRTVIATTLSDGGGKYRFEGLKPGQYKLRCQILGGYVYYQATDDALRAQSAVSNAREDVGDSLNVKWGIYKP